MFPIVFLRFTMIPYNPESLMVNNPDVFIIQLRALTTDFV